MAVRFVHAADLHLGSPLETVGADSEQLREQLRDATYTAFERVVDLAIDENVDFLLVAGDLYDQKSRSIRVDEFLANQFTRLDGVDVPVYVIYGNHDPLGEAASYVEFPPNVHELGHADAEERLFPDDVATRARIWGQSYRTEAESRRMHRNIEPADATVPNIGMVHTGLNPDSSKYAPGSPAELTENENVTYWALGHIHQTTVYETDPPIVHPGVPQGRHAGEPGPGGCVLAEIDGSGAIDLEFVPTSPVIWKITDVPVDGESAAEFDLTTIDGVQRYIEQETDAIEPGYTELESQLPFPVRRPAWDPAGYVCRWRLVGHGNIHDRLVSTDEPFLERVATRLQESTGPAEPFVYTDSVVDRTSPELGDVEELREGDKVAGKFFELVEDLAGHPEAVDELMKTLDYGNSRNIWQKVDDPEAVDDDKLALTEERMESLIERAQDRVLDELLRQRAE